MRRLMIVIYVMFFAFEGITKPTQRGDQVVGTHQLSNQNRLSFQIKPSTTPSVFLIQNQGIDTVTTINNTDQTRSAGTWMGAWGFYVVYIQGSKNETSIQIESFESNGQSASINIKEINSLNLSILISRLAHAVDSRFGNGDKNLMMNSLFAIANEFESQEETMFAGLSHYEAAYTAKELGNLSKAEFGFSQAYNYWNSLGEKLYASIALNQLGKMKRNSGQYSEAETIFKTIIQANNTETELIVAHAHNNLAHTYISLGDFSKAETQLHQSLELKGINLTSLLEEGIDLNQFINKQNLPLTEWIPGISNLARVYDATGQANQAIGMWKLYLELAKIEGNRTFIARAQNNLGVILINKGDFDQAYEMLNASQEHFSKQKNPAWLSLVHYNLGSLYEALTMFHLAEISYKKSLKIRSEHGLLHLAINNIIGLARINLKLKKNHITKDLIDQANNILNKGSRDESTQLKVKFLSHQLALAEGNKKAALSQIQQITSQSIEKASVRSQLRYLYHQIKLEFDTLNSERHTDNIKALAHKLKSVWDTKLTNEVAKLLTKSLLKENKKTKAKSVLRQEIERLTSIFLMTYKEKNRSVVAHLIKSTLNELAQFTNDPIEAFEYHNQVMLSLDQGNQKSNSNENAVNLISQLEDLSFALEKKHLSQDERSQIHNRLISLKARHQFSINISSPGENSGLKKIKLQELQTNLADNTLLIQFAIGEQTGASWWISKDRFVSHHIPSSESLRDLIQDNRRALIEKHGYTEKLHQLSELLLGPLSEFKKAKRIVVVLDHPLNLVPFSALPDPRSGSQSFLAENSELQRRYSLWSFSQKTSSEKTNTLNRPFKTLLMADPVTHPNDQRFSKDVSVETDQQIEYPRLLGTTFEAKILKAQPHVTSILGFDLNKNNFWNTDLESFDVIHIASHAFFNRIESDLSALIFSAYAENGQRQPAFLRAYEIQSMKLNTELVVLSGCETGLGGLGTIDHSYGLGGLTNAFLQAGAKNVIGSLWEVDDNITTHFMTQFYSTFQKSGDAHGALKNAKTFIRDVMGKKHPIDWAGWYLIEN